MDSDEFDDQEPVKKAKKCVGQASKKGKEKKTSLSDEPVSDGFTAGAKLDDNGVATETRYPVEVPFLVTNAYTNIQTFTELHEEY
ncbi:hypothetical protein LTR78_008681 [Recurvomyces mirabilis]|uniref:Uncharacterized protein n=1 Tax=Recurvomyces mirabilis TaxID=574656 RepID=A0AAE0TSV0_9PEZI|nr:hypothetical protein LTR78_008681 [Recurvomyces mirabilis]KAK5159234.1 hypothetical protein LTS14_002376 [Recurvomyces mirabilis]